MLGEQSSSKVDLVEFAEVITYKVTLSVFPTSKLNCNYLLVFWF